MAASEPPRLTIVQPGAGPTGVLGSIGVGFQPWGEETGGALSIVEHPFPVGALVAAHLHTRETSTPSSPKAKSGSDPASGRSSSDRVDTSPYPAAKCAPCGTQGRYPAHPPPTDRSRWITESGGK